MTRRKIRGCTEITFKNNKNIQKCTVSKNNWRSLMQNNLIRKENKLEPVTYFISARVLTPLMRKFLLPSQIGNGPMKKLNEKEPTKMKLSQKQINILRIHFQT